MDTVSVDGIEYRKLTNREIEILTKSNEASLPDVRSMEAKGVVRLFEYDLIDNRVKFYLSKKGKKILSASIEANQ